MGFLKNNHRDTESKRKHGGIEKIENTENAYSIPSFELMVLI